MSPKTKTERKVKKAKLINSVNTDVKTDVHKNKVNERLEKLKELKTKMTEANRANKVEVYAEHQRNKTNPKLVAKIEKKRVEADRLQARMDAEEKGEDYERERFWTYSAEQVEKYEAKEEAKKVRSQIAFTDFGQVAEKKYNKLVDQIKPNLAAYREQKKAIESGIVLAPDSDFASQSIMAKDGKHVLYNPILEKPSSESVDRLVNHVNKQIANRAKFSKVKVKDEDINYINDRNAHFNRKISRAFDKYTKEIKDNLERGTAL